jgi:hypothetical protein
MDHARPANPTPTSARTAEPDEEERIAVDRQANAVAGDQSEESRHHADHRSSTGGDAR